MKIIYNNIIPFKGYVAINLFGTIFARKEYKPIDNITINHESIHTAQMKELLYIGFYIWYFIEWIIKLIVCLFKGWNYKNAYYNIAFEYEAYLYEHHFTYLKERKPYFWFNKVKQMRKYI